MAAREPWIDLFLIIPVILCFLGYGALILRLLAHTGKDIPKNAFPTESSAGVIAYCMGLGMGAVSLLEFAIGAAGLYSTAAHIVLIVVGTGLCFRFFIRIPLGKAWAGIRPLNLTSLLAAVLTGGFLIIQFLGCIYPAVKADELTYHLTLARQYNLAGGIIETPHILHGNFPLNAQMLYTLGLGIGTEVLCRFIQWLALATGALTCLLAGKRESPSTPVGWMVALFYTATLSAVHLRPPVEAGSDLLNGMFLVLGIFSLTRLRVHHTMMPLLLAGVFSGLSWGTKYTAPAFVTFPMLGYLLWTLLEKRRSERWREALKATGIFLIVTIVLFIPTGAKNFIYTHNPVYPWAFDRIASPAPYDEIALHLKDYETRHSFYEQGNPLLEISRNPAALGRVIRQALHHYRVEKIQKTAIEGDILLPLFFLLSITGLFLHSAQARAIAFAGLCANLAFFFLYGSEINRYYVATYGLAAFLAARHVRSVDNLILPGKIIATVSILLVSGSAGAVLMYWPPQPLLTRLQHDQELSERFRITGEMQLYFWMRENLPPHAYILGHDIRRPFHCPRRIYACGRFEPELIPWLMDHLGDKEAVKEELSNRGFTHLLVARRDKSHPLPEGWPEEIGNPVIEGKNVVLYKLDW
jgi:hypothetical protein